MERFYLKKLKKGKGKEQYHVEISNGFASLETIRENINISAKESLGYYELKKHKPCFDEGCSNC
jgi:hypothetical protein